MMQHRQAPIASRDILLKGDESFPDVHFHVVMWAPQQEGRTYSCLFQFDGLPCGSQIRKVVGSDSLSSVQRAMEQIAVIGNCLPFCYQADESSFEFLGEIGTGMRPIPAIAEGLSAYRAFNFSKALPLLLPFADAGTPEIQLLIGSIYRLGDSSGFERDAIKARFWLKAAAAQGNGQAYFELCDPFLVDPDLDKDVYASYPHKAFDNGFKMHLRGVER